MHKHIFNSNFRSSKAENEEYVEDGEYSSQSDKPEVELEIKYNHCDNKEPIRFHELTEHSKFRCLSLDRRLMKNFKYF